MKGTNIDGDLSVSHDVALGGGVTAQGGAHIKGSVKIDGWLDAPNIKAVNKGLFTSEGELNNQYPEPLAGWFAIVVDATDETKGFLYRVINKGWANTSTEARQLQFLIDSVNVYVLKTDFNYANNEVTRSKATESFTCKGEVPDKQLQYHSAFKNVTITITDKEEAEKYDLSSFAIYLIRKGFDNKEEVELRWSVLNKTTAERDTVFAVVLPFASLNSNGFTHITKTEKWGVLNCDVNYNYDFPKTVIVWGAQAEPALVVQRERVTLSVDKIVEEIVEELTPAIVEERTPAIVEELVPCKKSYNSLFTENEGGYIKIDSVALAGKVPEATTESTAATYAEIDVLEGETYNITARGSSYVAAWAVIDADRKVLSHVGFAEGSKFIVGIVVERVVIPAGAARLIVNKVAGSTIPSLVKVVAPIEDIPTLYQKVANNKVAVDNAVEALTSMSKSYAELFEQNRGTYYNIRVTTEKLPSNPIQTDLGFTHALIPVVEGERYNIVAKGNQNFVAWATADADKKIMRRPETASADNVETTLSIEKNERFLLVNSLSATFVPSLVKVVTPIEDISVLYQKAADSENILSAVAVLKGKKILCLGDSITEFRGYAEASTTPTGRYSDYLAEKTGATVYNGGIGAAHMEQRGVLTLEPSSSSAARAALDLPALADALATGDWNYQDVAVEYLAENADDDNGAILAELKSVNLQEIDVVTIFIGTNDYGNPVERLGIVGDTEPLQNSLGGFGHAVKTLLTANPKLRIFYFSPMVRYFGDLTAEWDSTKWSDNMIGAGGIKFTDMVDKMIENAAHWKIPVCDMYRTLGINEFNIKSVMTYNGTDGTHPRRGNKMLANKIASFIVANNNLNV